MEPRRCREPQRRPDHRHRRTTGGRLAADRGRHRGSPLQPAHRRHDLGVPRTGPTVGAQFTSINRLPVIRRWTSTSTITVCEPGRRFAFAVGRDPDDPNSTWSYDLRATPTGTCVTESWAMVRESWIVRIYFFLIGQQRRLERGVDTTLVRLKARAESDRPERGPQHDAEAR